MSSSNPDPVIQAQDRFIAAWGQMGGAWGISRTMAEVFALLYISAQPLCTDDVMERLQISRGNASMSLRALQEWGICTRVHRRGDRKEYFESEHDVWTIFKTIARERKKRELDPVVAALYEIRDLTGVRASAGGAQGGAARGAAAASGVPAATSGNGAKKPGAGGGGGSETPGVTSVTEHNERMDAMLEFMTAMDKIASLLLTPEGAGLRRALALFD
ncbi:MAG: hypothetical protein SFZ24_12695 [Planctomycetota bacterium]|nr:hypothetical protein [Planctomycetota bacterium]